MLFLFWGSAPKKARFFLQEKPAKFQKNMAPNLFLPGKATIPAEKLTDFHGTDCKIIKARYQRRFRTSCCTFSPKDDRGFSLRKLGGNPAKFQKNMAPN